MSVFPAFACNRFFEILWFGACERDLETGNFDWNYTRVWNVPAEIKETTRRFWQSSLVVARVASFVVCAPLRRDGFDRWPRTTHGSVCVWDVRFFSRTCSNRGVKKMYKTRGGFRPVYRIGSARVISGRRRRCHRPVVGSRAIYRRPIVSWRRGGAGETYLFCVHVMHAYGGEHFGK